VCVENYENRVDHTQNTSTEIHRFFRVQNVRPPRDDQRLFAVTIRIRLSPPLSIFRTGPNGCSATALRLRVWGIQSRRSLRPPRSVGIPACVTDYITRVHNITNDRRRSLRSAPVQIYTHHVSVSPVVTGVVLCLVGVHSPSARDAFDTSTARTYCYCYHRNDRVFLFFFFFFLSERPSTVNTRVYIIYYSMIDTTFNTLYSERNILSFPCRPEIRRSSKNLRRTKSNRFVIVPN